MFYKSLQWRLVGIFILITIFLIVPISLYLNNRVETKYYQDFKRQLEQGFANWDVDSTFTAEGLYEYLHINDNSIYEFHLASEYQSYTIFDTKDSGNVIYSSDSFQQSDPDEFKLQLYKSENFINVVAGEKTGNKNKLLKIGDKTYFDYARLVSLSDGDYVLYFRYDSEDWQSVINSFNNIIIRSLFISIAISLVLGYFLSRTITMPIKRIMRKAKSLAAGNFDQVLEVKSQDEIGQLANSFNHMANSLKKTLNEVSYEKNKIETILNYMTDGVIAFNLKGKMIHANPESKRLIGKKKEISFNEFTQRYSLDISLEEIMYLEAFKTREFNVETDTRFIKVYFAIFTDEERNNEGIIVVMQDMTRQQKLELMRREFVANVSHELRTPITSIKSYAETLLDGALDDRETAVKFLNVINSESDRMTRLVRDLLELSRFDNKQMQWNMQEISLVELVGECVEAMHMEAKNKKQVLENHVIGDIPNVIGDSHRLEQVLVNVLGNAIKYTPEEGKITVFIGKTSNWVYFKVADNGIGIPNEDLPRIFERFFRVDKARSREMGGTGLGLSIASEIIKAHNGEISLKSKIGKGTEVTVKLPASKNKE